MSYSTNEAAGGKLPLMGASVSCITGVGQIMFIDSLLYNFVQFHPLEIGQGI